MNAVIIPLVFAVAISVTEYLSKSLNLKKRPYFPKLLSFSAGVSATYLLLELLPLFAENAFRINKLLFIALLVGFIGHHIAEKSIYQHNRRHELVKMLSLEENIFYYIYHVILGILLVLFLSQNVLEGIFFGVSILAFTVVSNLPAVPHNSERRMIFLSSSTFVGALLGIAIGSFVPMWLEFLFVGLVAGVLLFTVTRHHIPYGRKGNIEFFIFGFLLYAVLIILKWFL